MESIDYQLEKKVKKKIKMSDYTFKQLAEKVGMTEAGLYTALKKNTIKFETLNRISVVLETSILYFLEDNISAVIDGDINEYQKELTELKEQLEKNKIVIEHLMSRDAASKEAFDIIMKLLSENSNLQGKDILPLLKSEKAIQYMTKYGLLNHKIFE